VEVQIEGLTNWVDHPHTQESETGWNALTTGNLSFSLEKCIPSALKTDAVKK